MKGNFLGEWALAWYRAWFFPMLWLSGLEAEPVTMRGLGEWNWGFDEHIAECGEGRTLGWLDACPACIIEQDDANERPA